MMANDRIRSLAYVVLMLLAPVSGLTQSNVWRARGASSSWCRRRAPQTALIDNAARHGDDVDECGNKDIPETFVLPVFPLRKSVRMPSEALTLNLYEPRYLDLAEYVLKQQPRIFGALYSSKKPQIIREGEGPIVPMVEPGDVGVVCSVLYNEDAIVPISRNSDDGLRRRVKLKGLAIGRFRIEKVIHNGYGGGSLCEQHESVEPLPFILVEASRVDDVPVVSGTDEEDRVVNLERKVFRSIMETEGLQKKIVADLWGNLVLHSDDDDLMIRRFEALLPSPLKTDMDSMQQTEEMQAIENALSSWAIRSSISVEDQRRQTFSFAVSSAVAPEKPQNEALLLLSETSSYHRLQYAYNELQKRQSWFSALNRLF